MEHLGPQINGYFGMSQELKAIHFTLEEEN